MSGARGAGEPLLMAYYGDDFTGSTDVMEALGGNGVPTVLFTRLPDEATLGRLLSGGDYRAVGLAGVSRSQPPEWMDRQMPAVFGWLKSLEPELAHYKVCSTFDSGPRRGSIGRAMEIGLEVFGQGATAVVAGTPELGRYTCFGQLFARFQGRPYRIDRHPVMSRHPATPMTEADLLRHLDLQTPLAKSCLDYTRLADGSAAAALEADLAAGVRAVLVDVCDAASQARAGELLWAWRDRLGPLLFGASGVEYALIRAWRAAGLIPAEPARAPGSGPAPAPAGRVVVVSGSCSAVTEAQIRAALDAGFVGVPLDYRAVAGGDGAGARVEAALAAADRALREGRSPVVYTALGPPGVPGTDEAGRGGLDDSRVGQALGRILGRLVGAHGLDRVIVAGGG